MNSPITLNDFQKAIQSFPTSPRLVYRHDAIESSEPSSEKTTQELEENREITHNFREALLVEYGEPLSNFAFSNIEIELRLHEGRALNTDSIKKILRKAQLLSESLKNQAAPFPLPNNPSAEEAQAYLNALALYTKQETAAAIQDTHSENNPLDFTTSLTDDLVTSLFHVNQAETLATIGNYITTHPEAIPAATTAALGVPPNPIAVGAFGLTTLIMNSATPATVGVAVSESIGVQIPSFGGRI
ncbi:MAG: hypothetical protein A3F67_09290 [Verrucomicrobia bacterium RIFCSPHIGHO2_12_FULL_41_10]|nr:MAG: hypothetical protein A3F67_09290 [Verrucomicrobia bacterium RIFCSPHIGHO2_12_FULL_41_10]HLB32960.1 hypothetical protein [Chthoniobacterales bacterium]